MDFDVYKNNFVLNSILDNITEAIVQVDADGNVLFLNNNFSSMFRNIDTESLPNVSSNQSAENKSEFFSQLIKSNYLTEIKRAIQTNSTVNLSNSILPFSSVDDSIYNIKFIPILRDDEVENVSLIFSRVKDLFENNLKELNSYFKHLVLESPIAACIMKADRIVFANNSYISLFGYENLDEVIGLSYKKFIQNNQINKLESDLNLINNTHNYLNAEFTGVKKDGSEIYIRLEVKQILGDEGLLYIVFLHDISRRKQAELALKYKNVNYNAVFEGTANLIFLIDADFRVKEFNHEFEKTFEYSKEEILDKNFIDILIADEDKQLIQQTITALCKSEKSLKFSNNFIDKHNQKILIDWTAQPIYINEKFAGAFCICENITEREKITHQSEKVKRFYSFLSEVNKKLVRATDSTVLLDEICHIAIEVGKLDMAWLGLIKEGTTDIVAKRIYGKYQKAFEGLVTSFALEPAGMGLTGRSVREDRTIVSNCIEEDANMKYWYDKILGGLMHGNKGLHSGASLPIKENGKIIGVFVIYSEEKDFFDPNEISLLEEVAEDISFAITVNKQQRNIQFALEALESSEKRFKSLFENAPLAYQSLDLNGNIIEVNNKWLESFGYSPEEVIGKHISNFMTHDSLPTLQFNFPRFLGSGRISGAEFEFVTKKGDSFIGALEGRIGYSSDGNPQRTHCIITNISQLRQQTQKIFKLNRLYSFLSEINRMLVRIDSVKNLADKLTDIAYEIGGFTCAMYAIPDLNTKKIIPLSIKGAPIDFLDSVDPRFDDSVHANGTIGRAIKTKKAVWSNNILSDPTMTLWFDLVIEIGYNSIMSIPIIIDDVVEGVFVLFAKDLYYFDKQETDLLIEIGSNISYTLKVFDLDIKKAQADIAIRESEERFKLLFENAPTAYQTLSENGTVLDVNKIWLERLGYDTKEEVLGKHFTTFLHEKSISTFHFLFPNFLSQGFCTNTEYYMKTKLGHTFLASFNGRILESANRKTRQAYCIFSDITETRTYEEKLRYQAQLLVDISDAVISVDVNFNIVSWNRAAENLFGYLFEEVQGKNARDVLNLRLNEITFEQISLILKNTGNWKSDIEIEDASGQIKNVAISFSTLKDESNSITGFVALVKDVTERKISENQIKTLSKAVDQASVAIMITDVFGNIEYANNKFLQLSGYSSYEVIGSRPSILKSGVVSDNVYKDLWSTIQRGEEWKGEFYNKKKNGEFYWVFETISSLKDLNGKITNFIAIEEDISERKKILNELVEAKERAEINDRLKSNFLANMSHELRTPMVGILGFSDILRNEPLGLPYTEMANTIYTSCSRLLETLNLILNLSKIESDKIEMKLTPIDFTKVVRDQIKIFEVAAESKNIDLILEVEKDDIYALCDDRIIRDIINNLVNNAIKFTLKGFVKVIVREVENNGKNFASISVIDTGIGIPEDKTNLIFEEFRQVSEGLSRSFEGTGLGLTITKKLVNMMRGTISVKSKINEGSEFEILLPLHESVETAVKPSLDEKKFVSSISGKKKLTALLVEDDQSNQMLTSLILTPYFNVSVVSTGEEALMRTKEIQFDLILMDINLGQGINGVDTVKIIRCNPAYKEIPIIALTAYAMSGDEEEFLRAGCSNYISKPYKNEELLDLVYDICYNKLND